MSAFKPEDYQIHVTSSVHSGTGKKIFVARVAEIKGIYVEETTVKKAYDQAIEEIKVFRDHYLEHNLSFPKPLIAQEFSGDLRVRLGSDLHRDIALKASEKGVSLNQYIKEKLVS